MASITKSANTYPNVIRSPHFARQLRKFALGGLLTLFVLIILFTYLLPFGNMALMSLKDAEQMEESARGPIYPVIIRQYEYEGELYFMYNVPAEGEMQQWALVVEKRAYADFIDPANPERGLIRWEGRWRGLEPVYDIEPRWENFSDAWTMINFPLLFRNTLVIALVGMVGTLLSSVCVAYAFARFPIPGKNILFIILIGTIILPSQVTLVPTYAFFAMIGWTGTWLPLIIPHFFANAYNVFLLRQFFLTLPRELDEAAMIDGATPFQILTKVIIPQSWPAIVAVALFHFVFAWNDFFNPLIYLFGKDKLQPIAVGVQAFNFRYNTRPELIQATSLMAMVLPLVIFFVAQGVFMRGVVITGVDK